MIDYYKWIVVSCSFVTNCSTISVNDFCDKLYVKVEILMKPCEPG